MSREATKRHLEGLISEDDDCRVLTVTGAWGTGKTHLWNEVRQESTKSYIKSSLYCSLFGLNSIDEIKAQLLLEIGQLLASEGKASKPFASVLKMSGPLGAKLPQVSKQLDLIRDITLAYAGSVLKNYLIVLDDVERKDASLNVRKLLGFIDELSQTRGCKVLLIFNEEKLEGRSQWLELREKVIDQNLILSINTEEALTIAERTIKSASPSFFRNQASPPRSGVSELRSEFVRLLQIAEINNIRIIRKIINAADAVFGTYERSMPTQAAIDMLPSVISLTAGYYFGLKDQISVEEILDAGNENDPGLMLDEKDRDEKSNRKIGAQLFLKELGIFRIGELEYSIAHALETGLRDLAELKTLVAKRVARLKEVQANNEVKELVERLLYDPWLPVGEISKLVEKQAEANAELISPEAANELCSQLDLIRNCEEARESFLNAWIDAAESRSDLENYLLTPSTRSELNYRIEAVLKPKEHPSAPRENIVEATKTIAAGGPSKAQERVLGEATEREFIEAVASIEDYHDLHDFLHEICRWSADGTYGKVLHRAFETFYNAISNLATTGEYPRLVGVVNHVLTLRNLDRIEVSSDKE